MCASGLVGLYVGNRIAPLINKRMFRLILLVFLLSGSALLSRPGWQTAQDAAIVGITVVILTAAIFMIMWQRRET